MIPIVDCRSFEDYKKGHIQGATHIALEELDDCWHQLPAKGATLKLCCYEDNIAQLETLFADQQYKVESIIGAKQLLNDNYQLQQGAHSRRLWKGNPLLENHLELMTANIEQQQPVAVDIGCGSGRDSILLAQYGFDVIALDNKGYALEKVASFATKLALDVRPTNLDCEKNPELLCELIKSKRPMLIMQSRYLHRPLLELYKEHLPQGAMVAIHTFLEGSEKFGSPKNPAYLLKENELAERFSDWNLLLDDVHHLKDGRPLSLFLAQKP